MPPLTFRDLPSVDRVLRELGDVGLPRPVVAAVVRRAVAAERRRRTDGSPAGDAVADARAAVDDLRRARLGPVINGTGILIHTNLGRSPLAPAAVAAVTAAAAGYTNLELDLTTGARGGRAAYVDHALSVLCAADAAVVVNNCAAGLVLALRTLVTADRPEVVVSRGQLVQIGGGFRVPDILAAAGATLREVGTTNRTTAADYAAAIGPRTCLVLAVHRGNFYMAGFVADPTTAELAAVAKRHGVPFMVDLGTGAVFDVQAAIGAGPAATGGPPDEDAPALPPEREPTPAELVAAGVDVVCFSGDKLLGGPQAGVLAGRADLVAAMRRDPLFRALRCDKLVLSALQATVDLHLSGRAADELPVLRMMRATADELRPRAEAIAAALAGAAVTATVSPGRSQVGGGTMPRTVIPSVTLDLRPTAGPVDALAAALRRGAVPVVGYVAGGRLRIDLRTVFPHQDPAVAAAVRAAAGGPVDRAGDEPQT